MPRMRVTARNDRSTLIVRMAVRLPEVKSETQPNTTTKKSSTFQPASPHDVQRVTSHINCWLLRGHTQHLAVAAMPQSAHTHSAVFKRRARGMGTGRHCMLPINKRQA